MIKRFNKEVKMQRAIVHYIKKRSVNINSGLGEDHINQTFDLIDNEINQVRRAEIKKAREKKLIEWRKREKLNCGRNNKRFRRVRR